MTKPRIRLSEAAERDLTAIGEFTQNRWGEAQCQLYLIRLDWRLQSLAREPSLGRRCDHLRKGYLRFQEGKHVIFYRLAASGDGVEVVRILHERMLPERHLGEVGRVEVDES